jgi:hypothetical protein
MSMVGFSISHIEKTFPFEKSEFIGTIGERGDFFVKMFSAKFIDRLNCWVYNFVTREGHYGAFFSNDDPAALSVSPGDCLLIKMTPKRHSENSFRGNKETVFNRPRVLQNIGTKN